MFSAGFYAGRKSDEEAVDSAWHGLQKEPCSALIWPSLTLYVVLSRRAFVSLVCQIFDTSYFYLETECLPITGQVPLFRHAAMARPLRHTGCAGAFRRIWEARAAYGHVAAE